MKIKLRKPACSADTPEAKPVDIVNRSIFSRETVLSKKEAKRRKVIPIRPFAEGTTAEELAYKTMTSPDYITPDHYRLKNVMKAIRRRIILLIRERFNDTDMSSEAFRTDYDVESCKDMEHLLRDLKGKESRIKQDPEQAEEDFSRLKGFIWECNRIECILTPGNDDNIDKTLIGLAEIDKIGYAIFLAYELGEEVMKERFREHLHKPSGRPPSSSDKMMYWGKKLDDYYIGFGKQGKTAKSFAYLQVRRDWKKENPSIPVPDNDTFRKYWNYYLKNKK